MVTCREQKSVLHLIWNARRSLDASAHFVNFGVIFKKHFVFLYV